MTVDLNRLQEARAFVGSFVDSSHESVAETLDAVLDAPTVWWCLEHSASGDDARGVCWPGAVFSGSSPCRMVRASVLVVEPACGCTIERMVPDPDCEACGGDGIGMAWPDDAGTEPYPCPTCRGTGTYVYPDSAMGMGAGGQTVTSGPCPGWRNGQPGRRLDMSNCPHWHSPYRDYSKGSEHS